MKNLEKMSTSKSLVDLCVLSYNADGITERFLDNYAKNTDQDICHLYWVDNGSRDKTKDILTNFWDNNKNVSLVFNDSNNGVIGGRNQGFEYFLEESDSDYLMFLDNDQFVKDGWLEQHLSVLQSGYDLIGVEAWQLNRSFMPISNNSSLKQWFSYVGCGGMLIKREVVEDIGTFDERFNPSYFEDPDYNFRCYQKGYKIGWNFAARIDHLPHQTLGKCNDKIKRFTDSIIKFRKKWRGTSVPIMIQRDIPEFH